VQRNYLQIRQDVEDLVEAETGRMMTEPQLHHLIIKK
jgi:hypothetical protein